MQGDKKLEFSKIVPPHLSRKIFSSSVPFSNSSQYKIKVPKIKTSRKSKYYNPNN
jgi:hypothetical protein